MRFFFPHTGETASPFLSCANTPFDNQMLAVLWPPWWNNDSYSRTLSTHCESTVPELKESWMDLVLGKLLVRSGLLVGNGQGGLLLRPVGCQSTQQPITTHSVMQQGENHFRWSLLCSSLCAMCIVIQIAFYTIPYYKQICKHVSGLM